jgi:three-Cys-motif partner protein
MGNERLDVVGYWTEIKLQILEEYAKAYAKVLGNQKHIKHVAYIDGFAGAGAHISKETGDMIEGSPARILSIQPRFTHYHFVEMNPNRAERLRGMGSSKRGRSLVLTSHLMFGRSRRCARSGFVGAVKFCDIP